MCLSSSIGVLLVFVNTVSFSDCLLVHQMNFKKHFEGKLILIINNVSRKKCQMECDLRRECQAANYWRQRKQCEMIGEHDTKPVQLVNSERSCVSFAKTDIVQGDACGDCGAVCDPRTKECSVRECPKFAVDKGSVEGNMLRVGSKIRVTCNKYYRPEPLGKQPVCTTGSWEPLTQCKPDIVCDDAPTFNNAVLQSQEGSGVPGTVLTYSCKDGYGSPANKNNYAETCQENQEWTDVGFECRKNCFDPIPVEFATLNSGDTLEEAVRTYICLSGYVTKSGSRITVRCTSTGQWTAPTDSCLRSCGNPPAESHATISNGSLYEGSLRTYTCEPGYYVKQNGTVTQAKTISTICQASGIWNSSFECVSDCVQLVALVSGIDGISDSQITGTSYYDDRYKPKYGRLDNDKAWAPKRKYTTEYIQYMFRSVKILKKITTQGLQYQNNKEWVTVYKLRYSVDCQSFVDYDKEFSGNTDTYSHASNTIAPPILAQCVRVHALEWNDWITLRVEFYGC